MKYCIATGKTTDWNTPLLIGGELVDNINQAADLGYDAIEIHTPDIDILDADAVNAALKARNMFVATLGTGMIYGKYGLYLMDENEENVAKLIGMVKQFIDVAAKIGSKVTIGSIKGNVPKGKDKAVGLDIMGHAIRKIDEYAGEKGVTILLEATNRFENNALNTGKELHDFIAKYGFKHVQALMDSFHINIEEASIDNCLKDAGEYLGHIHFADNTRSYPGAGAFNFDLFCQSIKDIGYDGVLSVECFPRPDGITGAKETIKFFRKYFG